MKALLLKQYYSVERSFKFYLVLSVVITAILLFIQNQLTLRFAGILPVLLIAQAAFEGVKHDAISGWNKFMNTLPLRRSHIVQSQYLFYSIMVFIGSLVVVIVFVLSELFIGDILNVYSITWLLKGVGLALLLGGCSFPLTYHLGVEKSDMIQIISVTAGIAVFFLSSGLFEFFWKNVSSDTMLSVNVELLFSALFWIVALVLYIVSYTIALHIYKRKEF
ncbi:ABC-2 transporter permease [Cytobacillus sp. IB215316]|uniref:ABC-2 transporter permease n=1 Tax=Cytobacillus sp. IB215316 TaxID=3097354 RepID=UPI002A181927|nr:ABC-2 transporter permease [Cytobacillus sp. IB215316]MDX8360389.1 ABC-2 transporter permease [Cytobacillus sp. IB215316]